MMESRTVRGVMIPVDDLGRWCGGVVAAVGRGEPLWVRSMACYWRKSERLPHPDQLRPGAPIYLVHRGSVRGWAPLLDWRADRNSEFWLLLDMEEWTPLQLEWRYGVEFRRGWRYASWSDACELPDDEGWRRHNPHEACPGFGDRDTSAYALSDDERANLGDQGSNRRRRRQ